MPRFPTALQAGVSARESEFSLLNRPPSPPVLRSPSSSSLFDSTVATQTSPSTHSVRHPQQLPVQLDAGAQKARLRCAFAISLSRIDSRLFTTIFTTDSQFFSAFLVSFKALKQLFHRGRIAAPSLDEHRPHPSPTCCLASQACPPIA